MAVDGEQLIALPPLEAGDPEDDIQQLVQTDAVCLFVERARHVRADFALTDGNARAVAEVCQRLDGVPLAIELAAARVIALSPSQLLRRLDRRFQVLAGGRRGAVERHATLRAAIDWSYELLDDAEQRLLARLAVFSGGATLEAIEEICSGDPVEPEAVMDLLTGLVARSLVVADNDELEVRYRLLETIRQYGEERLADWGEIETLRMRHTSFYSALSAREALRFYGPEQLASAQQINRERDNIRTALANAIDVGDAALAVQLVANHPHSLGAILSPVGEVWPVPASRVLDLPGALDQPGYARALMLAAFYAVWSCDYDLANQLCGRALEVDQRQPNQLPGPRIETDICAVRAQIAISSGAYAEAADLYQRAAELARADGYPGIAAMHLAFSANSALLGGNGSEEAAAVAEQSVALARQSGMAVAIVLSLNALALRLVDQDRERAIDLLRESIERSSAAGEEISAGFLTASLVAGRLHNWDLTLALSARSMHLYRWGMAVLQAATCLAECARAFADDRPEVAGVLQGAAYSAFGRAGADAMSVASDMARVDPSANFVLAALRETSEIVVAALGDERRRELRAQGAAMSTDEAISCALANIDPKLLIGPIFVFGDQSAPDAPRGEINRLSRPQERLRTS
jgi:tetratricopeptide (TPR) repeat protein